MGVIIGGFGCLLAALIWWNYLRIRKKRLAQPLITSFGTSATSRILLPAEVTAIISQHLRQQNWAFGLVWFSVATAVLLGAYLLGSVILSPRVGYREIADAVTLVGDISIGAGAFKLYKASTRQFQQILKTLLQAQHPSATTSQPSP